MKIYKKCPTRVDLAGGTLDLWPLYAFLGEAWTVNLAIDIYTEVQLVTNTSSEIHVEISDLKYERTFHHLGELLSCKDNEMSLLQPHFEFWRPEMGMQLKTKSMSPVGGGLGGSSSLCISLIQAFSELLERPLDLYTQVTLAHNLEARSLNTPTGTQDYVPAVSPGLNFIRYDFQGMHVETMQVDFQNFNDRMLLVYTGRPHHSGINNWQVLKAAVEGDRPTKQNLSDLASISKEMVNICRNKNWESLPDLFNREYSSRVALSKSFVSPEISRLQQLVLQAGAEAVKICGAGGGGCVMVWMSPEARLKVMQICQENGFQVINTKAVGKANPA